MTTADRAERSGGPSISAIVTALDQPELLPACVERLRAVGVSEIVVVARESDDQGGTELGELAQAADVSVSRVARGAPAQELADRKTQLARASRCDWVAFLGADDRLVPAGGSLQGLDELADADRLVVFRYTVAIGPQDLELTSPLGPDSDDQLLLYARPEAVFPETGFPPDRPPVEQLQPSTDLVRPAALGRPPAGTHAVVLNDERAWRQRCAEAILVAHLPASIARGDGPEDTLDAATLDAEIRRGHVRSARSLLADPMGRLDEQDRAQALGRAQPWLHLAGRACAGAGIPVGEHPQPTFPSSYPTVLVPPRHVVKLFPPDGYALTVLRQEVDGLTRAARDGGLPVPELITSGGLEGGWRHLVMSLVPGENLTFLLDGLPAETVRDIAAWLGRFTRRLHAVRLEADEVAAGTAAFAAQIVDRHAEAPARLAARGALRRDLLAQVPAWLPSPAELLAAPGGTRLLHGGLQDDHIMVSGRDDPAGLRPVAVIDFGDATIGHAGFELGPAWWTWLNQDRRYLDAFLDAAEFPGWGSASFPRLALAWSLIRCAWNPKAPPYLDDARDLDELAELAFGAAT